MLYFYHMKFLKFVGSISLCFVVAFLGSIFTASSIPTWYALLSKPFFNPPNWIFAPVWTILYFLMGVSFYIVWSNKTKNKKKDIAVKFFLFQLILNLLWSLVFFGLRELFLSLIIIILLWLSILATIKLFCKISDIASYLLVPYVLWITFALMLNFAILLLNK